MGKRIFWRDTGPKRCLFPRKPLLVWGQHCHHRGADGLTRDLRTVSLSASHYKEVEMSLDNIASWG